MTQIRPGSGRPAMGEEDEQVPDRAMRTRFRPTRRNAPAAFLPASPPTRASADLRPGRLRAVSAIRQTDAPLPTSLRAAPDDVMVDPAVSCPAPPRSTTFASSTRYCRWWIGGSRAATPSSTPPSPALAGGRSGGPRCHSLLPSTPAPAPVWVPQRAQDSSPHALTHRRRSLLRSTPHRRTSSGGFSGLRRHNHLRWPVAADPVVICPAREVRFPISHGQVVAQCGEAGGAAQRQLAPGQRLGAKARRVYQLARAALAGTAAGP